MNVHTYTYVYVCTYRTVTSAMFTCICVWAHLHCYPPPTDQDCQALMHKLDSEKQRQMEAVRVKIEERRLRKERAASKSPASMSATLSHEKQPRLKQLVIKYRWEIKMESIRYVLYCTSGGNTVSISGQISTLLRTRIQTNCHVYLRMYVHMYLDFKLYIYIIGVWLTLSIPIAARNKSIRRFDHKGLLRQY